MSYKSQNNFAIIDDSTIIANGLYAYTHALVLFEEIPKILAFSGDKKILNNTDYTLKLGKFLVDNIPQGFELYACNHYHQKYFQLLKGLRDKNVDVKKIVDAPRNAYKYFTQAHHAAKNAAHKELERIVIENSTKKNFNY